jgi:hypothetical protein
VSPEMIQLSAVAAIALWLAVIAGLIAVALS